MGLRSLHLQSCSVTIEVTPFVFVASGCLTSNRKGHDMDRDSNGRYPKGFSGNLNGRPSKEKRAFTERQLRVDMLMAMEEELGVPIAGKHKKIPIILVVYKQLLIKAARGDVRCMFKAIDLRDQLISEMSKERSELRQLVLKTEKRHAKDFENVTDAEIDALNHCREVAEDDNTVH
jgi:hypothetical protein